MTTYNAQNIPQGVANGVILPVRVVNLREARELARAGEYPAILTAGPTQGEVADFGHPDHHVVEFDDVFDIRHGGPTLDDVRSMVEWALERERILVHCHAGISRSTATAWGICIAKGFDPEEAIVALKSAHPRVQTYGGMEQRSFAPNELIVAHLEVLLDRPLGTLTALAETYAQW
jgi:predicted protein tyrosine phosphatase